MVIPRGEGLGPESLATEWLMDLSHQDRHQFPEASFFWKLGARSLCCRKASPLGKNFSGMQMLKKTYFGFRPQW
jgi:hypothetical protein